MYYYICICQNYMENTAIVNLGSFWGQTVLPDRSILIEQKLMENATF